MNYFDDQRNEPAFLARDPVGDKIRNSVFGKAGDEVENQVFSKFRKKLREQMEPEIHNRIFEETHVVPRFLSRFVFDEIEVQLREQFTK